MFQFFREQNKSKRSSQLKASRIGAGSDNLALRKCLAVGVFFILVTISSLAITTAENKTEVTETSDKKKETTTQKESKESTIQFDQASLTFFENKVRPILVARCYKCHSSKSKKVEGGLLLDSRAAVLKGGDTDPAIVPGKPKESLLIESIKYSGDYDMPPDSKMPKAEIEVLEKWVKLGAPWPNSPKSVAANNNKKLNIEKRIAKHWAWQQLRQPKLPALKNKNWPSQPSDYFILEKLEAVGITPSPQADKRTLIRRAYFDLIGLPPSAEKIQAFLDDKSPKAFEKLVDSLLKSPRFGERWGRHWLDLVSYAETRGHEFDYIAPNAYQYRDYVIRALNNDVPYNQFLTEHIAGDLIKPARLHPEKGFNESILATGFWFMGEGKHSPVDIRADEADRMANQIDVFGRTFLGLTIACARCHDHKFDAIGANDYAAIGGYLTSSTYRLARFESMPQNEKIAEKLEQLKSQYRKKFAAKLAQSFELTLKQTTKYLQASRKLLVGNKNDKASITKIAKKYNIESAILENWVKHLQSSAAANARDPLYLWSILANKKFDNADAKTLKALVANKIPANKKGTLKKETIVVVDYNKLGPDEWLTNSVAFGIKPQQQGELILTAGAANPVAAIAQFSAATRAPAFMKLQTLGQKNPGRIQGIQHSSLALRTPSFIIKKNFAYVLAIGAGQLFAPVDSHYINQGPLHGRLISKWNAAKNNQPQWIGLDLRRYKNHRVHLELSPINNQPLSILKVVQADQTPPLPQATTTLLNPRIAAASSVSLNSIASEIAKVLQESNQALSSQSLDKNSDGQRYSELSQWILKNQALFTNSDIATDPDYQLLAKQYNQKHAELAKQIKVQSQTAMAMWDGNSMDEFLLIRGNANRPSRQIPRRFLVALGGEEQPKPAKGSGRLQLAKRMLASNNPYVPRVMVNRIWKHLMGRGIVPTVDDFGVLGKKPTHPELLDVLATKFVQDGWSIKRAIRRIMLSKAYQMSSKPNESATANDPDNALWHRMPIRRLEGEGIRDAILATSGRIDLKMYGPSVPIHLTSFMEGRGRPRSGPLDGSGRRSIYIEVRRNFLSPMMLAFDTPSPFSTVGRRTSSNVPAQALILLNDAFVEQQAQRLGQQIAAEKDKTVKQRIDDLYVRCFGRPAKPSEIEMSTNFMKLQAETYGIKEAEIDNNALLWKDLCHVLWNVKEFIFIK